MTSDSLMARLLKCFRTESAKASFPTFRFSFFLTMVGECLPMPGAESIAAFQWL